MSKEKAHADKLKTRISDLTSTISSKQLEQEEMKSRYNELVKANARFYESATKFRETYMKVDSLNEKKSSWEEELELARENVRELDGVHDPILRPQIERTENVGPAGTDQELADRLKNFDDHIMKQKQKQLNETNKVQDLEEELTSVRAEHVKLIGTQGQLLAREKVRSFRLLITFNADTRPGARATDRRPRGAHRRYQREVLDQRLRPLAAQQAGSSRVLREAARPPQAADLGVRRGPGASFAAPLSGTVVDPAQEELQRRREEYNAKSTRLHAVVEGHKQQKDSLRGRIVSSRPLTHPHWHAPLTT